MQPPATEGMYSTTTPRTSPVAPRCPRKPPISVADSLAEACEGTNEEARDETEAISSGILRRRDDTGIWRIGGRRGRHYRDQPGEGDGERRRLSLHNPSGRKLSPHREPNSSGQYQRN